MTSEPHPRHVAAPAEAILDEVERAVVGKRAGARAGAARAARRRPRAARGRARRGQDADRPLVRRRRPGCASAASSSRPTCCRPTSPASSVFDQRTARVRVPPGPVFANLVLADEINRAPPKTQAALLEAMQERQVTVDDGTHRADAALPRHRHPEPDRVRGHLPAARGPARPLPAAPARGLPDAPTTSGACSTPARAAAPTRRADAVIDGEGLRSLQAAVEGVHVDARSGATWSRWRRRPARAREVEVGASPRGSLALLKLARAPPRSGGATSSCPTTSRPSPSRRSPTGSCCARSCGCGASTPATWWPGARRRARPARDRAAGR